MQMLHRHSGSIQQYKEQIDDPEVRPPFELPAMSGQGTDDRAWVLQPDDRGSGL